MRFLLTLLIVSTAAISPALALTADDTMAAWRSSSDKERSELLDKLIGEHPGVVGAGISKCMNETATTPGHTDLQIGDVAKVCASANNAGQPV